MNAPSVVIGRYEYVDLPDLRIQGLKAKVDTGALTSSLHVEFAQELSRSRVRFKVASDDSSVKNPVLTRRIFRVSSVRGGSSPKDDRFFIRTPIVLGPFKRVIEVNLTNRSEYRFRMILGRSTIKNAFLVDVGRANVFGTWNMQERRR